MGVMVYRSPDNQDEGDLETGTRVCRECDLRQPMANFYYTSGKRYRRRTCALCVDWRRRELRAADPAKYRERDRWNAIRQKYGLTRAEFDAMLKRQAGLCAICLSALSLVDQNSMVHVDHDHQTGRVRGLLCFLCNTALGKFGDDPELLSSAIKYLERSA